MSTGETEDVEGFTDTTAESTSPGLGQALISVWHLWIATAGSIGGAYLAFTFVGASATDLVMFSLPTVLLFVSAFTIAHYRTREGLTGAAADSTSLGLGRALVSVWYLWVATAVSADAAYIAYTIVGASGIDLAMFWLPTALLFASALMITYYRTREGPPETAAESTSLGPGRALVSVWYLWVVTALSADAAYIAYTNPRLEASATDTLLFSFTTVLLFVSAVALAYYRTR